MSLSKVEKNKEKIICDCGGKYTMYTKKAHDKTMKHENYMKKNNAKVHNDAPKKAEHNFMNYNPNISMNTNTTTKVSNNVHNININGVGKGSCIKKLEIESFPGYENIRGAIREGMRQKISEGLKNCDEKIRKMYEKEIVEQITQKLLEKMNEQFMGQFN
jgi:hypothetical protein